MNIQNDPQQNILPDNAIKQIAPNSHWKKVVFGILVLALLGLGGFFLYQNYSAQKSVELNQLPVPQNPQNDQIPPTTETPTTTPEQVAGTWIEVEWYKEPKSYACQNEYYSDCFIAGLIQTGEYTGKELVVSLELGLGTTIHYNPKMENSTLGPDYLDYQNNFKFKGIHDVPENFTLPGTNYIFKKGWSNVLYSSQKKVRKLFDHPTLGEVYLMDNGCVMVKLPDQTALAYDLEIPFVSKSENKINFKFINGSENTETYQFNAIVGCGALCYYLDVQNESELSPQTRLTLVAKTSNNEDILGIANSEDKVLKDLYNDKDTAAYLAENGGYNYTAKNRYTYEQFLSYRPLLYWKDPLGRWIEFVNQRFLPVAEMCKPVIYLYPEKTISLTVKVHPSGGFTYTLPEYNNGWKVTAQPDGTIIEDSTQKIFPYLFWEGIGLNYPISKEGWVVKKEDMESFFGDILPQLGLQGREITDFEDYWVKRLSEAPFYRLNFLKQDQFNEIAPLEFEGASPQSFIRVMMTAEPLAKKEVSKPQVLEAPHKRLGFTFVEWGGVVLKQ